MPTILGQSNHGYTLGNNFTTKILGGFQRFFFIIRVPLNEIVWQRKFAFFNPCNNISHAKDYMSAMTYMSSLTSRSIIDKVVTSRPIGLRKMLQSSWLTSRLQWSILLVFISSESPQYIST